MAWACQRQAPGGCAASALLSAAPEVREGPGRGGEGSAGQRRRDWALSAGETERSGVPGVAAAYCLAEPRRLPVP